MGNQESQILTMGSDGGRWEAFTYDISNMAEPHFFVTEDHVRGSLIRFTPSPGDIDWQKPWGMLHGNGTTDYLELTPNAERTGGTYKWVPDRTQGRKSAESYYPNCEVGRFFLGICSLLIFLIFHLTDINTTCCLTGNRSKRRLHLLRFQETDANV